jgi:hypothetical protein
MIESERDRFYELISDVYAFYRVDCSVFALGIWWESCKAFDFAAVKDAMNRHAVNPDNGQFLPKPADVVKLIGGGTMDGALIAWSKVDRAMRTIGPYETVVFDDPIIHAVLSDMGGWIELGKRTDDDWPFRAKEFEARYRGYRTRGRIEHYPDKLPGIIDATNAPNGFDLALPTLIGDQARATRVLNGGSAGGGLQITKLTHALLAQVSRKEECAA